MRVWNSMLILLFTLFASGCGGGGKGSNSSGNNNAPLVTPAAASLSGNNVLPLIVDAGPLPAYPTANVPFVSVTICQHGGQPGTSNCQTIDHIIVDTGSSGLRIMSSALSLSLPQQTLGGAALDECLQFADGYTWGTVRAADAYLGGESPLGSLSIQVIGDTSAPPVPGGCSSNAGPAENTVAAFGGNGIIGVSSFQQDCGPACATAPAYDGNYYTCNGSACQPAIVATTQQIQNPVGLLTTDNNGVVIDLPSVTATGATTASGYLILGIGTQSNNGLGGAKIYNLDQYGNLITVYKDQKGVTTTYSSSNSSGGAFLDSGSNGLFFTDNGITQCSSTNSGFYCPASILSLSATNQGINVSTGTVNFSVGNADNLFNTSYGSTPYVAFSNLAGYSPPDSGFDWGLPFFYGRTVFTAIEGTSSGGTTGPYVAY